MNTVVKVTRIGIFGAVLLMGIVNTVTAECRTGCFKPRVSCKRTCKRICKRKRYRKVKFYRTNPKFRTQKRSCRRNNKNQIKYFIQGQKKENNNQIHKKNLPANSGKRLVPVGDYGHCRFRSKVKRNLQYRRCPRVHGAFNFKVNDNSWNLKR